jgi:hypothetical protein
MSFVTSVQPVISKPLAAALLAALDVRPAAPLLTTPKCHLFTAGPSPITPTNVIGDFTEATFAGYAAVVLGALSADINLPSGLGYGRQVDADFIGGAVVAPGETILGYWIDDGAAALYMAETFVVPIPIAIPGDFIGIDNIFGSITPLVVA